MSYFFNYISSFKSSFNSFNYSYNLFLNKNIILKKKKKYFKKKFIYKKKNKNLSKRIFICHCIFDISVLNFIFLNYLKFFFKISFLSLISLKMFSGLFLKNFLFFSYLNLFLKKFKYSLFNVKVFNFFSFFDSILIFKKESFFFDLRDFNFKNSIYFLMKYKNIKKLSFLQLFNDIIFFRTFKDKILNFKELTIKELFKNQIKKYKRVRYKWPFLRLLSF